MEVVSGVRRSLQLRLGSSRLTPILQCPGPTGLTGAFLVEVAARLENHSEWDATDALEKSRQSRLRTLFLYLAFLHYQIQSQRLRACCIGLLRCLAVPLMNQHDQPLLRFPMKADLFPHFPQDPSRLSLQQHQDYNRILSNKGPWYYHALGYT